MGYPLLTRGVAAGELEELSERWVRSGETDEAAGRDGARLVLLIAACIRRSDDVAFPEAQWWRCTDQNDAASILEALRDKGMSSASSENAPEPGVTYKKVGHVVTHAHDGEPGLLHMRVTGSGYVHWVHSAEHWVAYAAPQNDHGMTTFDVVAFPISGLVARLRVNDTDALTPSL